MLDVVAEGFGGIVHLGAVASGADARADPGAAWEVNAAGTARLAERCGERATREGTEPILILASTAEVYGVGEGRPRRETDPALPVSPYAASKLAAEVAVLEVGRRTPLRPVVARAFPHSGAGQDARFVIPALARRLVHAARSGSATVPAGNLEPVREILHVSDVVEAYCRLLESGVAGEVYNVACGRGVRLSDAFRRLGELAGAEAVPVTDPTLLRPHDIPHLVGDAAKLRSLTGWEPVVPLDDVLAEVVRAQAD